MDGKIKTTAEASESAAMPRAHVVHCDPNAPLTIEKQPVPESVSKVPIEKKSAAHWAYERLIMYIKNFEEQLDNEHEIAMGFVGDGAGVLRIEGLGYYDPDIITFYGTDGTGTKTQLIQHVSQLSVMLRALPKRAPTEAPNRIGFRLAEDLAEELAEEEASAKT